MSAQRIVVTSPWKLGLFVFLLVSACGFGLIYAYFSFFGGRLDFTDPEALRNFYAVCGSVAFLGLLGYLAVVSAAQPANLVANEGRQRRNLMKKAAKINDPNQVDLEVFQDEPTLVAILERWREDRKLVEAAREQALAPSGSIEPLSAMPPEVPTMTPFDAQSKAVPEHPQGSAEDQLAVIHEELFHPNPASQPESTPMAPRQTEESEPVYDLSSFGAVELSASGAEAAQAERIYDLTEFGAVEL